ncbi:[FeFe] hydrogenase H-cluster maturation GTPase HydF [Ruminococcus sp.]|uniref:[FeFe] hydrogenase H-cluster maturation GTPase HydF n=1 Tax=Ruminococcus sp. TaxID=41978 RepID=UPI0025D4BA2A|nr:[FeFe] hydrogenase H-cluster maturation GTPase HydF [Ruminococcus sp.]MCR4639912.1 [FeFe] hydrogenase H-cluster maturation GTPase HydF [Ruminococcus sp.]
MSLNDTPSSERVHIGFFGRRNAGKSSVVNAVTGQELSVVSDVKGTTTDPVTKAMELLPLGPVVIIDTPGFDDEGTLGEMRVRKTKQILNRTDLAVLIVDGTVGLTDTERQLMSIFEEKAIPFLTVYNKSDIAQKRVCQDNEIEVSALTGENIYELKERIAALAKLPSDEKRIVGDMLGTGDMVVLVTPIDAAAPKGRMILPQVQTLRDILDADAMAVFTKETQLAETLGKLSAPPKMVITDSQAFAVVSRIVPETVPLTSFSILMARYKGFLETSVKGAAAIKKLKNGDTVLISEGCTHHRQCGDIGSVKLPALLKKTTGKELNIELSSGREFPEDLSAYSLVIHCGGCMLNEREMTYRRKNAEDQGVPFTNYGIAIALMNGILKRSLGIFPDLAGEIE